MTKFDDASSTTDFDTKRDSRRQWLFRALLYGAPFLAASAMFATCRLIIELVLPPEWIKIAGVACAVLAAFGSAAGAFGLRNRLAWRVAHGIAAAVVSVAVFAVLLAVLFTVLID
jgi:hypothetical protein